MCVGGGESTKMKKIFSGNSSLLFSDERGGGSAGANIYNSFIQSQLQTNLNDGRKTTAIDSRIGTFDG